MQRGDKFEGGPSQHCLGFYIFGGEPIKKLEAVDLSILQAFPAFGDYFEGSRSHVVTGFFHFKIKKTCQTKTLEKKEVRTVPHPWCRPGPAKSGSLRGANLSYLYKLYIFYMRFGRPNYRLPARRGFGVRTGKHSCEGSDGDRRP